MMKAQDRISRGALAILCACAGMVLAMSQRALASGDGVATYSVTAPVNGWQVAAGSTIAVTWTSASPSSNLEIALIDVVAWDTEATIATNTADDGLEMWTIPCDTPPGQYLIYIEDMAVTDWTYGTTFEVLPCCPETQNLRQQRPRPEVRIDRGRPMPRGRPAPRP
jgi:uncharacterized protein YfaP (DUF2135 family)